MEKLFHLKENGTNVKTEVMAGITTFLAMAYILAVNPSMLGDAGMNSQGVFMATALAAAVATIVMALLANYPIALASGMGLNAYFAYTICLGELADQANPWQIALTAILVEGIIFIILSAFKFRETLVNCIPENLKYGITTGIGLFITFIGLQNAGIAAADASTKVALGDIAQPQVALALIGLDIAEQIDGGKFLGHEVAKSKVDALDRSFGIDSLRPELIEIAHDLLKRVSALGQLAGCVGMREQCGIATARLAAMLAHEDAVNCLRLSHQTSAFVISLDGFRCAGREFGTGGRGGFDARRA